MSYTTLVTRLLKEAEDERVPYMSSEEASDDKGYRAVTPEEYKRRWWKKWHLPQLGMAVGGSAIGAGLGMGLDMLTGGGGPISSIFATTGGLLGGYTGAVLGGRLNALEKSDVPEGTVDTRNAWRRKNLSSAVMPSAVLTPLLGRIIDEPRLNELRVPK